MFRFRNLIHLFLLCALFLSACGGASSSEVAPTDAPAATASQADSAAAAGETIGGMHTYVIIPAESKASYQVKEEFFAGALAKYGINAGLADVVGSTQEIEGQLQLNFDNLSQALGENQFSVKMNTFTTTRNQRDQYIRENGPRFNDFPLATFTANAIEGAPANYKTGEEVSFQLVGELTIRETTKPVTFAIKATILGNRLSGVATTRLKMSDFGIDPPNFANTLTVADEFGIEVTITAQEK